MQSVLLVIHVLLSLSLIGLVLIQQGKGADAGAAFGGGASSAVFGASGAGSFLTKLTTGLAIAFFATSLGLAYISAADVSDSSVVDKLQQVDTEQVQPTTDIPSAAAEQLSNDIPAAAPAVKENNAADLPAQ